MKDSEKLFFLAEWFDFEQSTGRWGDSALSTVHVDLREMASKIERLGGYIPNSQPEDSPDKDR